MSRAQDAQERPTYRIAVGPQQGRKVFTLQTLPAYEEPCDAGVGKVAGLSLHAGVVARADQRQKLERLCRCISRPTIAEQRLSLTPNGRVRYQLQTPYRDGTTYVIFEPLDFIARLAALVPKTRFTLNCLHARFAPSDKQRTQVMPDNQKGSSEGCHNGRCSFKSGPDRLKTISAAPCCRRPTALHNANVRDALTADSSRSALPEANAMACHPGEAGHPLNALRK